ncbi:MAG: hypothetical protein ACREV2_05285 [Burkholderiales bacterium]
MGAKQANAAILAAHRTFGEWREKTAHERAQMLKRWFEFVVQIPRTSRLVTCGQGNRTANRATKFATPRHSSNGLLGKRKESTPT